MLSTSKSIREQLPVSKFAPFNHFLSVQKLLLLHYLGYRQFPLEQECIKWCCGCSEWRTNGVSSRAITLKPSSAFDVRSEWPVSCSLVFERTHSDPENNSDVPVFVQSSFQRI